MMHVRELRLVLVVEDYEAATHLYRDVFKLEVLMDLGEDGGRGIILKVPTATLELADAEHGGIVDEIEVGRRLNDQVRIALGVDALADAADDVTRAGAEPMAGPLPPHGGIATNASGPRTACSSRCSSRCQTSRRARELVPQIPPLMRYGLHDLWE